MTAQGGRSRLPHLLEPILIRGLKIPNRVLMAPMGNLLHDTQGHTTDALIAYLGERGSGGAGVVFGPFAAVSSGHTTFRAHDNRAIPGLERLARRIAAGGSLPFLQIAHQGANRQTDPIGPCTFHSRFYHGASPREMTVEEIDALTRDFAATAARAIAAGFKGIELHAALGYLVGSFYSPHANRRRDEYGGLEGGLCVVGRIVREIRERCGEIPLGAKINAHEHVSDGIGPSDIQLIAEAFEEFGVDFLHVAAASSSEHHCKVCGVSPIYRTKHHLARARLAFDVKKHVSIPIIADGGIASPEDAEEILKRGLADMVSVGRAFIADPHWLVRSLKGLAYRPCIRCNVCHARQTIEKVPVRCAVNPHAGRELTHPKQTALSPLSVAVVGGGPAGMQAALTAVERGHRVTLFERNVFLGGKMHAASIPQFKRLMRDYMRFLVDRIRTEPIELRLQTEATPETLMELAFDVVVIATGSRPIEPIIPGLGDVPVRFAAAYLERPDWIGGEERVLIIGASKVGCEIAWYLHTERCAHPALVDVKPREELMTDEYPRDRLDLLVRLGELGIPLLPGRTLKALERGRAVMVDEIGRAEEIEFEKVLVAAGAEPEDQLYTALQAEDRDLSIVLVGDCVEPRNIYHAVREGFLAAYALGED